MSALSVRVFNRNEWNKGFAFGFVACCDKQRCCVVFCLTFFRFCSCNRRCLNEERRAEKRDEVRGGVEISKFVVISLSTFFF